MAATLVYKPKNSTIVLANNAYSKFSRRVAGYDVNDLPHVVGDYISPDDEMYNKDKQVLEKTSKKNMLKYLRPGQNSSDYILLLSALATEWAIDEEQRFDRPVAVKHHKAILMNIRTGDILFQPLVETQEDAEPSGCMALTSKRMWLYTKARMYGSQWFWDQAIPIIRAARDY
jgi:hypothetical protein